MTANPTIAKAAQVLANAWNTEQMRRGPGTTLTFQQKAAALDASGLLIRPEHTQALEACRDYAKLIGRQLAEGGLHCGRESDLMAEPARVLAVGRAALDAEKAAKPEQWRVEKWPCSEGYSHPWRVWHESERGHLDYKFRTEQQARAVANALNDAERAS